jgi:hypothetical protein
MAGNSDGEDERHLGRPPSVHLNGSQRGPLNIYRLGRVQSWMMIGSQLQPPLKFKR